MSLSSAISSRCDSQRKVHRVLVNSKVLQQLKAVLIDMCILFMAKIPKMGTSLSGGRRVANIIFFIKKYTILCRSTKKARYVWWVMGQAAITCEPQWIMRSPACGHVGHMMEYLMKVNSCGENGFKGLKTKMSRKQPKFYKMRQSLFNQ